MNRSSLEADVAAHPFLTGLNERQIKLLAECAMKTQFAAGESIFREGEPANRFYLIERGEVAVESARSGAPTVVDHVQAGDLLGWSWLFPPFVWHFGTRAVQPTTAIFFYGTILREDSGEQDPVLGYELFKRMSEVMNRRLQSARARLLANYSAHDTK